MSGKCITCNVYHEQIDRGVPWTQRTLEAENLLMLLIGVGIIVSHLHGETHLTSIPWETFWLVIFLGIMLAFTRVWQFFPTNIPVWLYVPLGGLASAFMDSFLVLVIIVSLPFIDTRETHSDIVRFRTYVMLSALIAGLLTYFGEVYALPIALMYGMREWYSMLWIAPPVTLFIAMLAWATRKIPITRHFKDACKAQTHPWEKPSNRRWMAIKITEFWGFIAILLAFKNPLLLIGIMLAWYGVWGYGKSALHLWRFESEVLVLLLLVTIAIWASSLQPMLAELPMVVVMLLAVVNSVAVAVVFPATGDFHLDIAIISSCVLALPISSLVGVIVFKSREDWVLYIKFATPWLIVWIILIWGWYAIFTFTELGERYYESTGFVRPILVQAMGH